MQILYHCTTACLYATSPAAGTLFRKSSLGWGSQPYFGGDIGHVNYFKVLSACRLIVFPDLRYPLLPVRSISGLYFSSEYLRSIKVEQNTTRAPNRYGRNLIFYIVVWLAPVIDSTFLLVPCEL